MFLRPFYPVEESGSITPSAEELVNLLLELSLAPEVCHNVLTQLNIRELLVVLRGIVKDDVRDDFYDYDDLSQSFQKLWISVVGVLNSYPCVKLVDKYSAILNESIITKKFESNHSSGGNAAEIISNPEAHGSSHNNSLIADGDLQDRSAKEIKWYELAIDSKEYDFLLEYLLDMKVNKIEFPLVEVKTKKFHKIFEVLDKHCKHLKISNDHLSVIKNSDNLVSKLSVFTLTNYEHFEVAKKIKYETLNVIGNEVDAFSISSLIKNNSSIKSVYLKGRLRDNLPFDIPPGVDICYDMASFDTINMKQFQQLGIPGRFHKMYLNFTRNTDVSFEWLKSCKRLRYLYYSFNYGDVPRTQHISASGSFESLEELVLKYCDLKKDLSQIEPVKRKNISVFPSLKYLTLINCVLDSGALDLLFSDTLFDIFLIDCTVKHDAFVKLPRNLRNLTIVNRDVSQSKNLTFLSYKVRSTNTIPCSRKCCINLNEKLITLRIPDCHNIYILKQQNFYYGTELQELSLKNLKIPFNATLYLTVYPMFDKVDFSFLRKIVEKYHVAKINIELYSFINNFFEICNIEGIDNVTIHKYDVVKLQEHLQQILAKKEIQEQDKKFFLPYPCARIEPSIGIIPKDHTLSDESTSRSVSPTPSYKRRKPSTSIGTNIVSEEKRRTASSERNRHVCEMCGKRFARSTALKRHLLVHKNHRPFKCDRCGNCFKRSDHLKVHQRVCSVNP